MSRTRTLSTGDVFQILLRSFHAAHCLILEEEAMLTTLTAAVVVPTKHKGQWQGKALYSELHPVAPFKHHNYNQ